jgi:AbrB family looped-hinge helix DNA binding protein
MTLERKVVRVGNSLRVTIPKEIQTILRLKVGDVVVFAASNGDIVIRKK